MNHLSAGRARAALASVSSVTQENEEPVDTEISTKLLVSAAGPPSKAPGAKFSCSQDTSDRKLRRALHSIDTNLPRLEVNSPRRPLSNTPSHKLRGSLEATKARGQTSTSVQVAQETNKAAEGATTGHKRSETAADDESKAPIGSNTQSEEQEGENLAWMDMMLALLEKRYGSNSSLPVCLTDLEAANIFQLPQRKKLKTGVTSSQAATKHRSSLDATRSHTRACNGTNNGKMSATPSSTNSQQIQARFDQQQDKTKEDKRQRLVLRHAQQIQASSVSSSTSCGCKTGCLKMYCMCFSSRGFCHAGCACDDCKNGRKNQTERVTAIQNYLANDPRAFSFASLPQDANTTGFLHLLPQKSSAVVMRGCRCKKSKCLKKYCECFQNCISCTSHCRCMDCSNHSESSAAHHHAHLHKGSFTTQGKCVQSTSSTSPTTGPKPFHPVRITVTKQPRRNHVGKTLRLNL